MKRAIADFPRYSVDETGRVFRTETAPSLDSPTTEPHTGISIIFVECKSHARNGYLRVKLTRDGKRYWRTVHGLVMATFGSPMPDRVIAHIDGNPRNNALSNLRWSTQAENEADKKLHGTHRTGPRKRLTVKKREKILYAAWSGTSLTATAKRFGVHRSTVARIVRNGIATRPEAFPSRLQDG